MTAPPRAPTPWWKKLGWLILIWTASVMALGAAAWLMRMLMRAIGMSL